MKLPLTFLEKKEKAEYFLALVIRNEKVTSVIFEKIGNTVKYISHDEEYFKNTVEDAESEEFITVLDKVITQAETALADNVETHKTIYGLKDSWIEDNKIKKEYLDKLKKAGDELGLTPIGFLASSESIINLVQKEEGAPITAILADVGKKYITVSWIKGGKILETKSSEIHESASYTVDTLLKHFQTPGNLPTRIIILDSEEEELTQEFISHLWSKSLAFLHLPQIMNLAEDASVKAMLLGAATQMGTELLYDSSKNLSDERPTRIEPDELSKPQEEKKDVIKNLEEIQPEEKKHIPDYVSNDSSLEFFGFLENADIAKTPLPKSPAGGQNIPDQVIEERITEIPEDLKFEEEQKTPLPLNAMLVTSKIKIFLPKLLSLVKKIKINKELISSFKSGNKKLLIIPAAILALLVTIFYFYLFTTKATINILVNPKEEQKTTAVTFSPSAPTDIKNAVIAAEFVTVAKEGSVTTNATGNKDVGNPAKGTVTVFNNSDNTMTFPADTVITSSNGLKFTFDKSTTVASASGDIFSGTKPGTANVNVTASAIGQESNLPSGTKFTLGSNSSVAAKNDNAFSGGTKKQITVVSKEDLQKLLDMLPKELEEEARNDLKTKIASGKTFLPTFIDKSISDETFDKKADDQANQVTLKATVTFKAASYTNSDIESLASSLFDSSENSISSNNLSFEAKNIVIAKNKDVLSDLTIKAKLLPKIDKNSLSKQLAGISFQKAKNMLSNLSQVKNAEIILIPNIPFLPKNLPSNPKNIIINITSN